MEGIPISPLIDIGVKIFNAFIKYWKEKKSLDLFRLLVKVSHLDSEEFVENTLLAMIPTILKKQKNEDKFKRKLTKICVSIPKVIKEQGYEDVFPDLTEKKKGLFDRLHEFENKSFDEIRELFSENIKELTTSVRSEDGKNLNQIEKETIEYMELHFTDKEQIETKMNNIHSIQDYGTIIYEIKQNFYNQEEIIINKQDDYGKYIDGSVTGIMADYLPTINLNANTWYHFKVDLPKELISSIDKNLINVKLDNDGYLKVRNPEFSFSGDYGYLANIKLDDIYNLKNKISEERKDEED